MKVIDWLNKKDVCVFDGDGYLTIYAFLRNPIDLCFYIETPFDGDFESENMQMFVHRFIDCKILQTQKGIDFYNWDVVEKSSDWVFFKRREPSGKVTAVIECFAVPYRDR